MKLLVTCAAAAALALLASAGAASAQDVAVTANIGVTSDYVFRGYSQNMEEPTLQGGLDLTVDNGLYAGIWASKVDYGDDTDGEIDFYAGYRSEVVGFSYDVGVLQYTYPGAPNAADWDYTEFKLAASRAVGPATLGAAVYYSPDYSGSVKDDASTYVELNAAFSPIANLTISGAVGEQMFDPSYGSDYTTWNLGATYAFPNTPLAIDVRYSDTDIDPSIAPLAEQRVYATAKVTF